MTDLLVFGAGIFGLSVAYACAKRGAKVQVVDPNGIAAGSSGGIVGALAPHTPERWEPKKQFQFESLIMAEGFWSEIAALGGGTPGYARLGRVQPVAEGHTLDLARERIAQAADLWQGQAVWEVLPRSDLGAWAPETSSGWVIRDTLSARVHPRKSCHALAMAITALGGSIALEASGPKPDAILWATGVDGLVSMSKNAVREVGNGVKGQAMLLAYAAPDAPQLFSDGLHIVPHSDGTVAIGSTSERYFDDPTGFDALGEALLARAHAVCPLLKNAPVIERWAGVRPRSRTRAPMLGNHPQRPGEFVANGGFKIGFGMAPKIGEVMADLILEGQDTIPDGFRAEACL